MPTIDMRGSSGSAKGAGKVAKQTEIQKAAKMLGLPENVISGMRDITAQAKLGQKLKSQQSSEYAIAKKAQKSLETEAMRAQKQRETEAMRAQKQRETEEAGVQKKNESEALKAERKRNTEALRYEKQREREASKAQKKLNTQQTHYDKAYAAAKTANEKYDSAIFGGKSYDSAQAANQRYNSAIFGPGRSYYQAEYINQQMGSAPPGGGRGGGTPITPGSSGGRWNPFQRDDGRPVFRHNAGDILAEGLSGEAIGGVFGKIAKYIAGGVAAAIELPMIPGQMMRGMLALAQPAIDLHKSTFAMGRAGGFNGANLYGQLTNGGAHWMDQLMLTPEKAMQMLGTYGIMPRSAHQARVTASSLALEALQPGFAGMSEDTVPRAAGQVAGYGGSPGSYLVKLSAIMEMANQKGMDRSKVLGNIQDAMDKLVGSGAAGVSTNGILDMITRFASTGTAGGRTGQSAANMIGGLSDIANSPAAHPSAMFMMYSQLKNYGGLKTKDDVINFVGQDAYDAIAKQSPKVANKAMNDILAASRSGNTYAAMNIASGVFLAANPGRVGEIIKPALGRSVPSYLQSTALSGITGTSLGESYAYGTSEGVKAQAGIVRPPNLTGTIGNISQFENQSSQLTLAGAGTELSFFTRIAATASTELEKFVDKLRAVNSLGDFAQTNRNPDFSSFWNQFGGNIKDFVFNRNDPHSMFYNPNHQ